MTKDRRIVIALPSILDLENNYEKTVSHFRVLRHATRSGRDVQELNFDAITYISPSAALVLASEVDCWNQIVNGTLRACHERWDNSIKRLLNDMGYFELLGLERPEAISPPRNTTFMPFMHGATTERDPGKLAVALRKKIESVVGQKIKKQFLFEGLSEAITNVVHHAYPNKEVHKLHQWWVSASFDRSESALSVTFFDQGIGIPKSLPSFRLFEKIREMFAVWTDSQKIEAAMELGRTSTENEERGKGLQNLVEFARTHREGKLTIISLSGAYRMQWKRSGNEVLTETTKIDHENSIGGTLIEWSVKL